MPGVEQKRRAARLHHEIPVAYRTVGSFLSDWATNISQGGLFINTRTPLPVGTTVRILLQLPGVPFPHELQGRVIRIASFGNGANQVPGMAIEFIGLDDVRRRELELFVARLRRDLEEV